MKLGGLRKKTTAEESPKAPEAPHLARRSMNARSTIRAGRTISGEREHLETASERVAAHKAIKKKQKIRLVATALLFVVIAAIVIFATVNIFGASGEEEDITAPVVAHSYEPTIEIVDEDTATSGHGITGRMKEYIGQAEADFRELGYTPVKAVIPLGSIREVDFYLDGIPGRIKLIIDRGTGVSAEDADRMIRYLTTQNITEYEYIDVRIDGKAYWK